jgi:hypothetical protein
MTCVKTGATVEETQKVSEYERGPYKIWSADVFRCGCGNEVIAGFAKSPMAEYFDSNHLMCRTRTPPSSGKAAGSITCGGGRSMRRNIAYLMIGAALLVTTLGVVSELRRIFQPLPTGQYIWRQDDDNRTDV